MEYEFPRLQIPFAEFIYFDQLFLPHEIERINALWSDSESVGAVMSSGGPEYKQELRKSDVHFIHHNEDSRWIYDKLAGVVLQCNAQYFGFDLSGFEESLQLAKYGVDDYFQWHMDFGPNEISHRKLSVTVQLTDPDEYEGGDLLFRINDREEKAPRTRGTVVVFPSFIHHKVTSVTRGQRRSIVAWAAGRPFR